MATKTLRTLFNILVVLQVFLALAQAQSSDTTTVASTTDAATTPVPDTSVDVTISTSNIAELIKRASDQFNAALVSMKAQISQFRANYDHQMQAIAHNGDLMEDQIRETNQKLYALAFLNDWSKFCVQKYSSLLIVTEVIHSAVLSCVDEGKTSIDLVLDGAVSAYEKLLNYYTANWEASLTRCAVLNKDSSENETLCVSDVVQGTIHYFNLNSRTFKSEMDGARCAADSRIRTATECVFETGTQATTSIGSVHRQIDDCISGVGVCTPCPKQPECQKVEIQASLVNSTLETILNPFKGVDLSTCITVTVTADIVN